MPIVMSKDEWARITRWTHRDREDPDVVRQREYVRYLNTTSNEMTKTWPNSVENVNKRNEELRLARIATAEQANTKFYKRYLKRRKEEQERLMFSARDMVFKNKDAPKLMLSAVIETCIQKERNEQVKFLNEQRRLAAERKRKEDNEIIRKTKEWEQLLATKKKRRFEANKQHQKEILDQCHEIFERNRAEYESELKMQKVDNIQANQQIDALKKFEDNFKAAEKARIWADMDQAGRENAARRAEQAARARMDDRLIDVLLKSRARVERKRKQTEIDVKNEKLRVLERISAKLESGDAAREAKDKAILDRAIQEKDNIDVKKRASQAAHQAKMRKERTDARAQWLRDEQRRLHELDNARSWECMNRFKNLELYDDYKEKVRLENERKIKEFRADTLRLWKERTDRDARERAETRYFYGELAESKLRDADNKLLTYAMQLLQEAKDNDRPDYALHEAVDRYCKLYRLYPMPALPSSVAEHFPRYAPCDASRADAHYTTPAPPPPDRGPDAPDEEDIASPNTATAIGTGRNGLNDPGKPSTSKMSNKKEKQESIQDYKRAGRADGLQRRPAMTDVTLRPITVVPVPLPVPCPTDSCRCELKQ